jgi:glycosyltransferase involved in cell wall biosynthesis
MVSVIIPAYNEENSILNTVLLVHDVFKQNHINAYEIIVVNDGSTDRTAEILKDCDAIVIHHPHNIGYGRSLKDGIINAIPTLRIEKSKNIFNGL